MRIKCKILGMSYAAEKHSIVLEDLTPNKIRLPIIISTEAAIEISRMKSKDPEKSFFNRLLGMTDLKVTEIYIKGVKHGLFEIITKFNNGKEMQTNSSETFILYFLSPQADIYVHEDVMKETGVKMDEENNVDYSDIEYDEDHLEKEIDLKEDIEMQLEKAIEEEDYLLAAKLRDKLKDFGNE